MSDLEDPTQPAFYGGRGPGALAPDGAREARSRLAPPTSAPVAPVPATAPVVALRMSELAVASFVVACLGLSVLAIGLAVAARTAIRNADGGLSGDGLAKWALGIGIVTLLIEFVLFGALIASDSGPDPYGY